MELDYIQLASFGVVSNYDFQNRHTLFRDFLCQGHLISTNNRKVRKTVLRLITFWENYIEETDTKRYSYAALKKLAIMHLGNSVHEDILHYTRFYLTTSYLKKKGVFDIVSPTHLVDNWNTHNKLFWYEDEVGETTRSEIAEMEPGLSN